MIYIPKTDLQYKKRYRIISVCNRWVYMLFLDIEGGIVCSPFEKVNMKMHFLASGFPLIQVDGSAGLFHTSPLFAERWQHDIGRVFIAFSDTYSYWWLNAIDNSSPVELICFVLSHWYVVQKSWPLFVREGHHLIIAVGHPVWLDFVPESTS